MKTLTSLVRGNEGLCKPAWLNTNEVDLRTNPPGVLYTGFFRNIKKHWLFGYIKTGTKFHGYITKEGFVKTTEGL